MWKINDWLLGGVAVIHVWLLHKLAGFEDDHHRLLCTQTSLLLWQMASTRNRCSLAKRLIDKDENASVHFSEKLNVRFTEVIQNGKNDYWGLVSINVAFQPFFLFASSKTLAGCFFVVTELEEENSILSGRLISTAQLRGRCKIDSAISVLQIFLLIASFAFFIFSSTSEKSKYFGPHYVSTKEWLLHHSTSQLLLVEVNPSCSQKR